MPEPARERDDVLERAVAGDRDAWQILLDRHGPRVWGLCRRLAPDPEDAYQDVWAKVLVALPRFDPDGTASLRTWITRIAHRHLIDRHRRRKVRGEVLPMAEIADDRPGADTVVHRRQRAERLEHALRALPEGQRRVIVLHHLYGTPLEDVAREEGVAVGTVKSRLHRGRARLATLLGDRRHS